MFTNQFTSWFTRIFLTFVVIASAMPFAKPQEFWMQPQKFTYARGEKVSIGLMTGINFMGTMWGLKDEQVVKLSHHHLSKVSDLKNTLKEGTQENIDVVLTDEGTHLVMMQSNSVVEETEAEEFKTLLKDYDLNEVYATRENSGTLEKSAKVRYSHYTKLLLQAGVLKDDTFKELAGFPMEVVPEKNPYSLKPGDVMRFKILWQGKPIFGARVKVWNRKDNRTTLQNIYTEKDGTMETRISSAGPWMISVVQVVPSKDARVDWQSYSGSLVFGVE